MRYAYEGIKQQNAAAPLVEEYISLTRLRKLGYQIDVTKLDVYKAECFVLISTEIDALDKKAADKERLRRGKHR